MTTVTVTRHAQIPKIKEFQDFLPKDFDTVLEKMRNIPEKDYQRARSRIRAIIPLKFFLNYF